VELLPVAIRAARDPYNALKFIVYFWRKGRRRIRLDLWTSV